MSRSATGTCRTWSTPAAHCCTARRWCCRTAAVTPASGSRSSTCRGCSTGCSAGRDLRHLRPVITGYLHVDDLRRLGDHVGHPCHGGLEMVGVHVRRGGIVLERLDQHELVRVVGAPGPLEEDVARLAPGALGKGLDEGEPLLAPLGPDGHLDDDEDHGGSFGFGLRVDATVGLRFASSYERRPRLPAPAGVVRD